MTDNDSEAKTFRAMVENANRKFARVQDVPAYGRVDNHHYFHKVFKAYMRLWKYQQEFRAKLVESGLNRWEIGEIASRIGQLYFGHYMRTSEARFLIEAYVFYEAILNRSYFEGSKNSRKDLGARFKELRFYARFLLVSLLLNRTDTVQVLAERLKALVDDSKATFRATDFKEWRLVVQEIFCFMNVATASTNVRPLRYSTAFDSHPPSLPFVGRFHAKRVLKFRDAVLTSYHRNEVKFAEITLDTYRMLQCLEWEPGFFYQKHPVEPNENGAGIDHSGASGIIDINLATDVTDPSLPPNPKKAILYRPSVTHLIAVMATVCEELLPDSIMLIYLSAAGKCCQNSVNQMSFGESRKSLKNKVTAQNSRENCNAFAESCKLEKPGSSDLYDEYLWFGHRGNGGPNVLYPGDIIPFTRRPVFLIVDSNNSHAFKAGLSKLLQVLHGAERGETAAILLSPLRPAFKNPLNVDTIQSGSQFTFFLTAPLPAFCEMVGLSSANLDIDVYNDADTILSSAFSDWEIILCTSTSLNIVWAQVLSDHFLRRLILRFIFCRAVLSFFNIKEDDDLPFCLPCLPDSVSSNSGVVSSAIRRLAKHLNVADLFNFHEV
ncbi:protein SCAI [Cucumis melo var. makuwa]|uniref:Protein SCAI n=1 Tax=Cucumis melo var. makuwa TaxID=1194695 RepID=A0A5A7TRF5_CUCMM|nr:protein SCAI [Cucumis melo var. makuwa]